MRRLLAVGVLVAATLVATPAHAATHDIEVRNNDFRPAIVHIQPGDTVRWTAVDPQHTVTADDGRFNFHLDTRFQQVSWTAGQTEEYVPYYCAIHAGMEGAIVVGDPPKAPVPPLPTLVVPDDVPTIADAATGAQPGTVVLVRPGVYPEALEVTVPDLTIRGMGQAPGDVVVDGGHRFDAVTVTAALVTLENLAIRDHRTSGVRSEADGFVLRDVELDNNGYYGADLQGQSGSTLHRVTASRHTIAGVTVRDCPRCGARIDGVTLQHNGTGLLASDATGLTVRGSVIRDNGAGIVLRDAGGATIAGNTLTGNDSTAVRTASPFTTVPVWAGAGVWISGGRAHEIHGNTLSGHTYNVAVTGPLPVLASRIRSNIVDGARHADLGWDGIGSGVCFSGNLRSDGSEPSSDPPAAQVLYDCDLPATVGPAYPLVLARLAAHALRIPAPVLPARRPVQ
jgi:parallel beta-helix repeat protein